MNSSFTDRNLLFGIIALQMDFIKREQLIEAMNAWAVDKEKSLGELLVTRGAMKAGDLALLTPLVDRHVEQHGGDPAKSLASLSSLGSACQQLSDVADPEIRASLDILASARPENDADRTIAPPSVGESTSAGMRFRILRPHEKGGLGQVSVALDQELNREVALKEIQDKHADKPESRARFLLEAEVTGGLEHPGIVPVYGLGTYADGRPFYAMRFIRGDNLQRAIERFHKLGGRFDSLEFRQLLGRYIDVCNAVAYAHSRGVLHRDLKPGNIMLGKYGETLLVDWGLAKPLDRVETAATISADEPPLRPTAMSGTGETLPGSAVGTPEYMSPEQAAGRWDAVGPATDVYSLGATLYELLTGKPSISKAELGKMLRNVEKGEIAPPRQLKGNVPQALEAVCIKAMALKPGDRYGSALDLAKEIERWLADEPVTALREPFEARTRRWVRKHARLATGLAATLVLGTIGLGALAWQRESARKTVDAERAQTAIERDTAKNERDRALAARKRTREALNAMVSAPFRYRDPQKPNWEKTSLSESEKMFLNSAMKFYEEFAAEPGEGELARARLAEANSHLGYVRGQMQQWEESVDPLRHAIKIYADLATEFPTNPDYLNGLASNYGYLDISLWEIGQRQDALNACRDAVATQAKLVAKFPTKVEYRRLLVWQQSQLGSRLKLLGNRAEAEVAYRAALQVSQDLATEFPNDLSFREGLAKAYLGLGRQLSGLGNDRDAEAAFRAAIATQEKADAEYPWKTTTLGKCHRALALHFQTIGKRTEAESAYRAALVELKKANADAKSEPMFVWPDLASTYFQLGIVLEDLGNRYEAQKVFQQAAEQYERLLRKFPTMPGARLARARALARAGERVHSIFEAAELAAMEDASGESLYGCACIFSVTGGVSDDQTQSNSTRAVELLRRALSEGFRDLSEMLNDSDLATIRLRADYGDLLWKWADVPSDIKPAAK